MKLCSAFDLQVVKRIFRSRECGMQKISVAPCGTKSLQERTESMARTFEI